jgi:pyruvate/2-oxoglutarate/acetoin dehydrogenase E1 component
MSVVIPSSPEDKKKIRDAVIEMSDSMLRQESERGFQKDVCERIKDEIGLDAKYLKQLARVYHKQNFVEVQSKNEDFETLYEEIVK